jgi:hypothetical protein
MSRLWASNDAFFRAVDEFSGRLGAEGHREAAAEIKASLLHLNGLTDGWAICGESLEATRERFGSVLASRQKFELDALIAAARDAAFRR